MTTIKLTPEEIKVMREKLDETGTIMACDFHRCLDALEAAYQEIKNLNREADTLAIENNKANDLLQQKDAEIERLQSEVTVNHQEIERLKEENRVILAKAWKETCAIEAKQDDKISAIESLLKKAENIIKILPDKEPFCIAVGCVPEKAIHSALCTGKNSFQLSIRNFLSDLKKYRAEGAQFREGGE